MQVYLKVAIYTCSIMRQRELMSPPCRIEYRDEKEFIQMCGASKLESKHSTRSFEKFIIRSNVQEKLKNFGG